MSVGPLLANIGLHLGGARSVKPGNVGFLLGLGLDLILFRGARRTAFLEHHPLRHNLFYIHIFFFKMQRQTLRRPKRIPSTIPPYNRPLPAGLPYRYIR